MPVNPHKGEAELVAGDRAYTLALDVNALILAEQALDWDMPTILRRFESGNLTALRGMLWAALQRDHSCHLVAAGEIMAAAGVPAARDAVSSAIKAAFPATEAATEENPPKAAGGTGKSGGSGGRRKASIPTSSGA